MKKRTVKIIVAVCLIVVGSIISAAALPAGGLNVIKIGETVEKTYSVTEDFESILINKVNADIQFLPSEDGECKVVCKEVRKVSHSVKVEDGTLKIDEVDSRKWYDYISIVSPTPSMTVYLPESIYVSLKINDASVSDITVAKDFCFGEAEIKTSTGAINFYADVANNLKLTCTTGHITVDKIAPKNIELRVSTGDIKLSNVTVAENLSAAASTGDIYFEAVECKNFTANTSTGRIFLNNVVAEQEISLIADTGDISLDECDAESLYIQTSTGNVTGKLLSPKVFLTKSNTGRIEVPKTITGGKCEITTDTGNIKFE